MYAFDKGVNYFDTAPGYCADKSEDIFGIALKQMAGRRSEFYLATKAMPVSVKTADEAQQAVEKSLKRLNVDKIDFYHIWCVRTMEHYEMAMKKGGLYDGLVKCKGQGLIDHIAISTHLPGDQVRQIIEDKKVESVLLGVNILNFMFRWEGIQAAFGAGLGVAAMNPLGGGLIPKYQDKFDYLARPGETPIEAAIRFCVSCRQINVALVGFTTQEHIDTACKVADNSTPFDQADIDWIKDNICENSDAVCTSCGYCRGLCPKDIPVASYMQYYNDRVLFGKTDEEMIEQLKNDHVWGILVHRQAEAVECSQCGKCELSCTQHLKIIDRLTEIAGWEEQMKLEG